MSFELCYKCYLSREVIHPPTHPFILIGPEYASESEEGDIDSEEDSEDDDEDDDEEEKEEEEDEEEDEADDDEEDDEEG